MSDNDRIGSNVGWFLAGLGIGAIVGVLFAPKSGRELRENIAQSAHEGTEYLSDRAAKAKEQLGKWVERGRENVGAAVDAAKQHYRSATSPERE